MGGHIDCYTDLNSIYGYFGFVHLLKHIAVLRAHGVEVDFHPVYLPDLQHRSGNRVIWTVKARQDWLEKYELPRSKRDFGVSEASPPDGDLNNLFKVGQTQLPLRALLAIKKTCSANVYNAAWHWLYRYFSTPPQQSIKDEGPLREALMNMPSEPSTDVKGGDSRQFSAAEVDRIMVMAKDQQTKDELRKNTDTALKQGGFGAPWMIVRNSSGVVEPFFGSDRFAQIYDFLDLPYSALRLLPPQESNKSNL
ncbi:thioredoxin-like protein [Xylaria sp. FL0064]|nr:thioredoxin-like protein [Xylaria sp. FL0064]